MGVFGSVADARRHRSFRVEHASVLGAARGSRAAVPAQLARSREGVIDPDDVARALRPETALVSIGWANSEIGTVQPVGEIARVCRARDVRLHVDAVQAIGKVPIAAGAVDLCSITAHKIEGPKGIGALVVRRGTRLEPLLFGGSQERGLRPGTENVAGVAGFAAAIRHLPVAGPDKRRCATDWARPRAPRCRSQRPSQSVANTERVGPGCAESSW